MPDKKKNAPKKSAPRKGLGRGLSSLLGADNADVPVDSGAAGGGRAAPSGARQVAISLLHPNRYQPRRVFDTEKLDDLAASIKARGVMQPILVRSHESKAGEFEIIAGERRWRASQMAKLHEVPVVIREFTDDETLEAALVENIQRHDLNPVEEAEGYQRLMDEFGHTQAEMAEALGKSRSHIANLLRLLKLPKKVIAYIESGDLSMGHARALITADDPAGLAQLVVKKGLSVRDTEQLAQAQAMVRGGGGATRPKKAKPSKDADTLALEARLAKKLGLRVEIADTGKGGTLSIRYANLDQLDEVINKLEG